MTDDDRRSVDCRVAKATGLDDTVTVWRLEDHNGRGVYKANIVNKLIATPFEHVYFDSGDDCRPLLRCEGDAFAREFQDRGAYAYHNKFGFVSLRQMLKWFPAGAVRLMQKHGAELVKYKVPAKAVLATPTQCMFDTREAERISP